MKERKFLTIDNIKDLEGKITALNSNNDTLSLKKTELEAIVKSNKAEIEKLNSNLKLMISQKNLLQTEMQTAAAKAERELVARNIKINELTEAKINDQKQIAKLEDIKERLMFQITDIQNNLDKETSVVKQLNFDLAQAKREAEEKASIVEDQLDKLNTAKNNLSKDKGQLIEKLNITRGDLKMRKNELLETQNSYAEHREKTSNTIAELESNIGHLKESLSSLDGQHKELTRVHKNLEVQHKIQVFFSNY